MDRAFSPGPPRAPLSWGVAPVWYKAASLALRSSALGRSSSYRVRIPNPDFRLGVRASLPEARVNRRQSVDESGGARVLENRPWLPSLPRGEGRGEGERAAQQNQFPKL
jgi:hypothetical protein